MQQVQQLFAQSINQLTEESLDRVFATQHPFYSRMTRPALAVLVQNAYNAVLTDLQQGTNTNFADFLEEGARRLVNQGALPSDVMSGFNIGIEVANELFQRELKDDPQAVAWWFERIHMISLTATMRLSDAIIAAREIRIQEQASVIRDLSTPIMPVHDGILVVPLVGQIDAQRAGQIMETMLQGIVDHQADAIIIDITGVPMIDTHVAQYIIQAAKAVRLLGAEITLVGIGAEIAQTIVQLGIDLEGIETQANLRLGIENAIARRNRNLVR